MNSCVIASGLESIGGLMTDRIYCGHCEEQVENCLRAARDAKTSWMRSYFLTLAAKWTTLARDLEEQRSCGSGCPLRNVCGRGCGVAAESAPGLSPAAVA